MSPTEFAALPALLRRCDVLELLPMHKAKYYDMLKASPDYVVRIPGYKEIRVRKEILSFLIHPAPTHTGTNGSGLARH